MNKKTFVVISCFVLVTIGLSLFFILKNDNPTDLEYEYDEIEEYYTNSNNEKIYTKMYKPITKKKVPIVIYSHGLGATYRAATDYGEYLAKEGVALISIDFRGGSNRSKSDGLTTDMSIISECDDLEFILSKVKEFDFIDKNKIILMGSSQGGAVSALVSSRHSDIKGAVLLYPALGLFDFAHNMYSSIDKIPEEFSFSSDSITVGRKYFTDIWDINPYELVKNDTKKLIIIQGISDTIVPVSQARLLNSLYKNSTLYEIDGAGHGFDGEYFEEAIKYVVKYFKEIEIIR